MKVKHVRFLEDMVGLGETDGGGTGSDCGTGSGGSDCGGNGVSASGGGGGGGSSGSGGGSDGGSSGGDCSGGGGGTDGSDERQWGFGADMGDGAMGVAGTIVPGAAMADASLACGTPTFQSH